MVLTFISHFQKLKNSKTRNNADCYFHIKFDFSNSSDNSINSQFPGNKNQGNLCVYWIGSNFFFQNFAFLNHRQ